MLCHFVVAWGTTEGDADVDAVTGAEAGVCASDDAGKKYLSAVAPSDISSQGRLSLPVVPRM